MTHATPLPPPVLFSIYVKPVTSADPQQILKSLKDSPIHRESPVRSKTGPNIPNYFEVECELARRRWNDTHHEVSAVSNTR